MLLDQRAELVEHRPDRWGIVVCVMRDDRAVVQVGRRVGARDEVDVLFADR